MLSEPGATMKSRRTPALRPRVSVLLLAATTALSLLAGCDMLDESHSVTLMNQGVGLFNQSDYPGAVEKLEESVTVWKGNHKAFYMLGQIYQFKYTQCDKAHTYYDKAAQLVPDNAEYHYFKGACLVETKQDDLAEAALTKAVSLNEKHAEAYNRLGLLYERKGEPIKAANAYGSSVKANARTPYAYHNLGDLYYRNGKLEEARQVFKNGSDNNPENAELHHGLGVAYLSMTRHREALIEFESALELKPSYPSALYNLGMAYQALGDRLKAKTYLEKFISSAGGGDNAARIAAAEARLLEIMEAEKKR